MTMGNGGEHLGYLGSVEVDEISNYSACMAKAVGHLLLHPQGRKAAMATTALLHRLNVRQQIEELRPVWRAIERMLGHNGTNEYLDDALAEFNRRADVVRRSGERLDHTIEQRIRFGALCRKVRHDGEPCVLALHDRPEDSPICLTRLREPFSPIPEAWDNVPLPYDNSAAPEPLKEHP